ncbi:MAG: hypothetical protein HXY24_13375 [Rubrivivax sp.]|nr:hypothetical protein [Rubrivivax sp.]
MAQVVERRHGAAEDLAIVAAAPRAAAVPGQVAVPLDALPFDPGGLDWTALDAGVTVGVGALRADLPQAGAEIALAVAR